MSQAVSVQRNRSLTTLRSEPQAVCRKQLEVEYIQRSLYQSQFRDRGACDKDTLTLHFQIWRNGKCEENLRESPLHKITSSITDKTLPELHDIDSSIFWAVIIGIDDYKTSPLRCCISDVFINLNDSKGPKPDTGIYKSGKGIYRRWSQDVCGSGVLYCDGREENALHYMLQTRSSHLWYSATIQF
ncbi:hypothetical protein IW262DRAFT_1480709 [Armillaria fumosa]|nr:hypothetical protein IW262DRAFT_1480709 [Armillaria fumosa]